jgi:hypothetical protein
MRGMAGNPYSSPQVPQQPVRRRSWAWTALGIISLAAFVLTGGAAILVAWTVPEQPGAPWAIRWFSGLAALSFFAAAGSFAFSLRPASRLPN